MGTRIRIDESLTAAGWLYFPRHKLAVGAVFMGGIGVVASAKMPTLSAYFIPLSSPVLQLLDVEIKDFY